MNPWMKFYPSDWRSDPSLRMCSMSARGLWMEMICVMHESQSYGSLIVNGRSLSARQLSGLAGISVKETECLISELEEAGVFSRDSDGTIFSRRMRRDIEKLERDRLNGKGGGNPYLKAKPRLGVNPQHNPIEYEPVNREDKAQKLEARSQIPSLPSQEDKQLGVVDTLAGVVAIPTRGERR